MIECIAGLVAGTVIGLFVDSGSLVAGGFTPIVITLALADELIALVRDTERRVVKVIIAKVIFFFAAFWIQERTGAPIAMILSVVLLISIYGRISGPEKSGAGAK